MVAWKEERKARIDIDFSLSLGLIWVTLVDDLVLDPDFHRFFYFHPDAAARAKPVGYPVSPAILVRPLVSLGETKALPLADPHAGA